MDAETAYMFRHATLRDAAYQLQPPSQRARLHEEALAILESMARPEDLPALAAELARHAQLAAQGVTRLDNTLSLKELEYLRLAAGAAESTYQHNRAIEFYMRIAEHPLSSVDEQGTALARAGEFRWFLGLRAEAEQAFAAALKLELSLPVRAVCEIEYGVLLRDVDESADAEEHLRRALGHARECGDRRLELRAQGNLATVIDQGIRADQAHELYDLVIALAESIGVGAAVGISYGQIGKAYEREGRWPTAEVWLRRAIINHEEHGDKLNAAANLSSLAKVLLSAMREAKSTTRIADAENAARESIRLNHEIGNLPQKLSAQLALVECALLRESWDEARHMARHALEVAAELGLPAQLESARRLLEQADRQDLSKS